MWSLILFATAIIGTFITRKKGGDNSNFGYIIFSYFIFWLTISGIIVILLPSKTETVLKETYNLTVLQDNNNVKGSFFLGAGYVGEKMIYSFYYENNGFYEFKQIEYHKGNVKIKYSNGKPKIERYSEEKVKDAFINNFTFYCDCGNNSKYIIYVPEGTIIQNYSLDAK